MNSVTDKFKESWVNMDISTLSECISEKVKFSAFPSHNSLTGSAEVINHIAFKFQIFKEYHALSTLERCNTLTSEFIVKLKYEDLYPVTTYAVRNDGIYMVACLEPRIIIMNIRIQLRCKSNKISNIKIFQNMFIECRKTA